MASLSNPRATSQPTIAEFITRHSGSRPCWRERLKNMSWKPNISRKPPYARAVTRLNGVWDIAKGEGKARMHAARSVTWQSNIVAPEQKVVTCLSSRKRKRIRRAAVNSGCYSNQRAWNGGVLVCHWFVFMVTSLKRKDKCILDSRLGSLQIITSLYRSVRKKPTQTSTRMLTACEAFWLGASETVGTFPQATDVHLRENPAQCVRIASS